MVTHAAFGGSTNLILHLPAVAFSAGLARPTVEDWTRVNRQAPRIVDALPNGPKGHPRYRYFSRRRSRSDAAPAPCGIVGDGRTHSQWRPLGDMLDWWEQSSAGPHCAECCSSAMGLIG